MTWVRRVVERATSGLWFRRRLPAEFGGAPMYVSPSAGLKFLFKRMASTDAALFSLAHANVKPGQVVWDVGANIGLFSFAAAGLAGSRGKVFAFEPNTDLVRRLRQSAAIQPASAAPVAVIPVAVARELAFRTFDIAARSNAASFLTGYGSSQAGGVAARHLVLTVPLDWVATQLPLPDVLKIDVEGAELEVLEGARDLLTTRRPVVLCEVSSSVAPAVAALLKQYGYRLFDGENPSAGEVATACWSTVALPA